MVKVSIIMPTYKSEQNGIHLERLAQKYYSNTPKLGGKKYKVVWERPSAEIKCSISGI